MIQTPRGVLHILANATVQYVAVTTYCYSTTSQRQNKYTFYFMTLIFDRLKNLVFLDGLRKLSYFLLSHSASACITLHFLSGRAPQGALHHFLLHIGEVTLSLFYLS